MMNGQACGWNGMTLATALVLTPHSFVTTTKLRPSHGPTGTAFRPNSWIYLVEVVVPLR
jgi:hypothetical protein